MYGCLLHMYPCAFVFCPTHTRASPHCLVGFTVCLLFTTRLSPVTQDAVAVLTAQDAGVVSSQHRVALVSSVLSLFCLFLLVSRPSSATVSPLFCLYYVCSFSSCDLLLPLCYPEHSAAAGANQAPNWHTSCVCAASIEAATVPIVYHCLALLLHHVCVTVPSLEAAPLYLLSLPSTTGTWFSVFSFCWPCCSVSV